MTVQNKMAVLMMSGGLGELGTIPEKATASKSAKTESFNEVFKTADRSNAGTDRFENVRSVQNTDGTNVGRDMTKNVAEGNEHAKRLKSVFEKVISGNEKASLEEDVVVTDEVMALLQALLQNVSQQLQEILGMSEEQLNLAVDGMGMTEMDLLNPDSVTELIVNFKADGDFSELISNEELHNEVTSLVNMLEAESADIAKEMGLTGEQFEQFIDKALENMDAPTEDFVNISEAKSDGQALDTQSTQGTSTQTVAVNKSENKNEASQDNMSQNNGTLFGEVISNLEQSVAAVTDEPQAVQIVRQVIEQIQLNAREGMTSMEIQLTPENLGRVNLQVTAKDGVVTAQITTDTLAAKEAIEAQVNILRENLNEQGLKVEAVEVTVESHKFEANSEQNRERQYEEQGTRRHYIDLEGVEEVQFEDTAAALAREIMMSNGNRMDIVT
ncbi:MAG: hypothetical protein E7261_08765 [Lachnospiraceae bacterium]|nr:hypothetical protein [Lachnospiraceae bacterium]